MEAIRQVQRKYGIAALLAALFLDTLFCLAGRPHIGHGVLLGGLFSILNFILLGRSLPRQLTTARKRATGAALGSIFGRSAILAIPLVMALKLTLFDVTATICGLFLVQGCILVNQWTRL